MILCTNCGTQNKDQSKFCTSCGNTLANEYTVGRLVLLRGQANTEYLLGETERLIGREAENDIVIADSEMSARHARFTFINGAFWLEDLGSRNGTFVNGQRLTEPVRLKDEDLLKMGRTMLKFKT